LLPDGTILVAGGFNSDGYLRSAELYDPDSGRFRRVAPMTTARADATATLLDNGRLLVADGGNPSATRTAELFDPASGKWSPTGSRTDSHPDGAAALLQDGRVLVAGYGNEGDVYSPATGTWTATGPMVAPGGLSGSAAALLPNGQVLYAGGDSFSSGGQDCFDVPSASAELYTP